MAVGGTSDKVEVGDHDQAALRTRDRDVEQSLMFLVISGIEHPRPAVRFTVDKVEDDHRRFASLERVGTPGEDLLLGLAVA